VSEMDYARLESYVTGDFDSNGEVIATYLKWTQHNCELR
jgi:hypothetical protein